MTALARTALEAASDELAPIARRTLHVELAERLRRLVLDGYLAPGERINEQELADRFAVSRTPVREALKVLAAEGLITITPHRGATVTALSEAELADAFPVMGALEALAGELAAKRATDAEIEAIAHLHTRMLEYYRRRDLANYFKANQAIHEAILSAARNETLSHHSGQLAGRVRLARYRANMSEERWAQAVAEHEDILAALMARKPSVLARILKTHLDNKLATVRQALEKQG